MKKPDLKSLDLAALWRGLTRPDTAGADRVVPPTGFTAQLTLFSAAAMAFLAVFALALFPHVAWVAATLPLLVQVTDTGTVEPGVVGVAGSMTCTVMSTLGGLTVTLTVAVLHTAV